MAKPLKKKVLPGLPCGVLASELRFPYMLPSFNSLPFWLPCVVLLAPCLRVIFSPGLAWTFLGLLLVCLSPAPDGTDPVKGLALNGEAL